MHEFLTSIPSTALVLVAVMTSPRDMEIARLLGWYRIPLRKAPKVVDVDYLAFYQTSGFVEDERGKIQYCAKVRGHELTTRGELLKDEDDHPRANEEYYKIQIGPLIKLAQSDKHSELEAHQLSIHDRKVIVGCSNCE